MTRYKNIDGEDVQLIAEEEAARDAEEQAHADRVAFEATPKTDAEIDAEVSARVEGDEALMQWVTALCAKLPGPTSFAQVKADAQAKGRLNMNRTRP